MTYMVVEKEPLLAFVQNEYDFAKSILGDANEGVLRAFEDGFAKKIASLGLVLTDDLVRTLNDERFQS